MFAIYILLISWGLISLVGGFYINFGANTTIVFSLLIFSVLLVWFSERKTTVELI